MSDMATMHPLQPSEDTSPGSFDPHFAAREALLYMRSGYIPIPLHPKDKTPLHSAWQNRLYIPEAIATDFPTGCNLGVRTGTQHPSDPDWHHVMVDIDCSINDDITAVRVLQCLPRNVYPIRTGLAARINFHCLSDLKAKHGGKATMKAHESHPYAYDGLASNGKPKFSQIEVRGAGHQSMVAGSLHPGDKRMPGQFVTRWLGPPLHSYHVTDLPRLSGHRIQEILAIYAEPKAAIHRLADAAPGSTHDSIVAATAWMANNKWPDQDVEDRMSLFWEQLTEEWDEQSLDRTERQFIQEWQTALRTARAKFEGDEKPSKAAATAGDRDNGPKLRLPRLMADRWRDVNTTNSTPPKVDAMGQVRIYDHGWWRVKPLADIRHELMREFDTLAGKDAKEAVTTLLDTLERLPETDQELICTRNGSLDLNTLTLHPHSPDFGLTTAVPFEFNPDPVCPFYDQFMGATFSQCLWGDEDERNDIELKLDAKTMRDTWEEFAGYCLTNSTALQSMLVLVGPTGSGKSTVARTLSWILPEDDISSVPLSRMEDARYHANILSRRVNVSYETGTTYSEAADFINSTAAGDPQTVRRMREEPVSVVSPCKLIFVGNRLLRTADTSGAIQRRMVVILAPNKRSEASQRDVTFPERLRTEAGAIFSRYVIAGNRLLRRGRFLSSAFSVNCLEENKRLDSTAAWYSSRCEYDPNSKMPNEMLYYDYRVWSIDQGFKPVNVIEWGTRLSSINDDLSAKQARVPGNPKARQRVRPIRFQEGVQPNLGPGGGNY